MRGLVLILVSCIAFGFKGWSQSILQANDTTLKTVQLPMFDLGFGWSFLMADVGNSLSAPSPTLQLSYGLTIRQPVLPYLSISLDFATGRFFGERALGDTGNINYQTSVITQALRLTYEASHLFSKNENGFIPYQPYIGVGVGLISWRAKGDLKDASGKTYHYWSDGSIRDLAEDPINIDQAMIIERDMTYETDLRDANLDGLGRYDQMALHIPIELGFRYQFTRRVGAHIKGVYHLNFTDLIDNITHESVGDRAGSAGNDNHISAMVGLSVYLGEHQKPKRKKKSKQRKEPKEDLIALEGESATTDQGSKDTADIDTTLNTETTQEAFEDSVAEFSKESSGSAETVTKAISTDETQVTSTSEFESSDSIATNETEPRPNEESAAFVDEKSLSETNQDASTDLEESLDPANNSLALDTTISDEALVDPETANSNTQTGRTDPDKAIAEVNGLGIVDAAKENGTDIDSEAETGGAKSTENESLSDTSSAQKGTEMSAIDLIDKTMGIESTKPKLAGSYHWADLNKDRYISADEVLHFIDLLFDGDSKYTVPMIHELIEYYFDQD